MESGFDVLSISRGLRALSRNAKMPSRKSP